MLTIYALKRLKYELLLKAQLDLSGKVTVKRLHHPKDNKRKPYWQTHHVLPEEVEDGDKVIDNHHLLPLNHPQRNAPPPPPVDNSQQKTHGNAIPQEVKDKVNDWEKKNFSDRPSFLAALKKMGLDWDECLTDKGINLMRAKKALGRAIIEKRFDPNSSEPKLLPVSPVNDSQQSNTTSQSNNNSSEGAKSSKSAKSKLSDAAKAATESYFSKDCNGDRPTFYQKLKQLGIKWKEVLHEGINFMFASAALSARIDEGFDPRNPTAAPAVKQPSSAPPSPKNADASMLEIPDGATEREKNLINLINNMTNIHEIQGCARMGLVPEDERAKQFILNKLQLKLAEAIENPEDDPWFREKDSNGKSKFPAELRNDIKSEWGQALLQDLVDQHHASMGAPYPKTAEGFGRALVDQLDLVGCKKHAIAPGFELLANFSMDQIVNARDYITGVPIEKNRADTDVRIWDIVKSLNEAYADYTTDDYQPAYSTNLGYTGMDESIYVQRYDVNKEGFVRALRKIAKDNPSLQSKTEEIISTYDEMMKTVGYNPHVLSAVMESSNWSEKPPSYYKVYQFGMRPCRSRGEAKQRVEDADRLSSLVIEELTKRGYSQDAILESLQNTLINDGLNKFHIKNASGATDEIDFSQLTGSDGKPVVYMTKDVYWGKQLLNYTRATYLQQHGLGLDEAAKEAVLNYNAAKKLAETSEDDYKKVHQLSMKLAGFKLIHHSGNDLDYSKVDVTHDNWQTYRSDPEFEDESPEMDIIMANLRMHKMYHDVNTEIVRNMSRNAASNFNDKGKDYAGNFDYYSGTIMSQLSSDNPRLTQLENDVKEGATYTSDQLLAKINQQMDQVPGISPDYVKKLKAHYSLPGKHPKADSFAVNWGQDAEAYMDSPIKDILYQVTQNVSEHVPATATKPTFQKLTAKRLNYVPFDFDRVDKRQQPRLYKPKPKSVTPPDPKELKAAREKLLKAAKCSIATEPEDVCEQMRKKFAGEDFDYKPGEKTLGGGVMKNPVHSIPGKPTKTAVKAVPGQVQGSYNVFNQVPLFNSPFFKINNSIQQENFQKKQDELKATCGNSNCYTPMELFQGTSYWSTASILGKYGAFFMGNELEKTNKILGLGAYFASKIGKICPYVGNLSYAHRPGNGASSDKLDNKDRSDGICIMARVMRGKNYSTTPSQNTIKNNKLTSLSRDVSPYYFQDGTGANDFEIAVRNNDLIEPHHIVDVSMRTIGFNIDRCPEGYRDKVTGRLLYDTNGVSLKMRNNE